MFKLNTIKSLLKHYIKRTPWKGISILILKALIILFLFNIADKIYCTYNTNYICSAGIGLSSIHYGLLLTIIGILLIDKMAIRIILLSVIALIVLLEYLYFQYFGIFIQPIAFYQAFTDTDEVIISFLDEFHVMVIPIGIIVSLLTVIILMKSIKKFKSYKNSILGIIILISIFLINLYNTYNHTHSKNGKQFWKQSHILLPMNNLPPTSNFIRSLNYFLVAYVPKKFFYKNKNIFPTLAQPNIKTINPNRNIIFIIGETLRAKNINFLGYSKKTMPRLSKINGLRYSSIYSAGTMTKVSVPSLLNRVKYPGASTQLSKQNNNLFYLAKKNGFKTYFYSRQTKYELSILQNYLGKKYLDDYASKEMLTNKLKNKCSYDIALKQALETINLNTGNKFIVLHQRGSHSPYHKNYPKKFNKFDSSYDNSILYTDYVLSEIISYVKAHTTKPTYIIFTSDHGELLHEHGRNGHGWFFEEVYKVPFIYYAINQNSDSISKIPFSNIQTHFDVSNLVVSLLGYDVNITKTSNIYVNGSDIDALAGYLHIKLNKAGKELFVKKLY